MNQHRQQYPFHFAQTVNMRGAQVGAHFHVPAPQRAKPSTLRRILRAIFGA